MLKNVKAEGIRCVEILCIEKKSGAWGQSDGGSRAKLERCGDFTVFFQKLRNFSA